jgi:hypothetical protein
MTNVSPQSLAFGVGVTYVFVKYVWLTGAYKNKHTISELSMRSQSNTRWIWVLLPAVFVIYTSTAFVWDLPCAPRVSASTVGMWVVFVIVPLGISRASALVCGCVCVSAAIALWVTTTDTRCLFVSITGVLLGLGSMIMYSSFTKLSYISVKSLFLFLKNIISRTKDYIVD